MTLAGKRVVVTGADGFIGSHLVERLVSEGASVRALGLYNSYGSNGWLDDLATQTRKEIEICLGDIRDVEWLAEACRGGDIVFHLAALIAIPYSYTAPRSFIDTNVSGTLNVLEASRRANVARLIHTSTSEVYGTPEVLPITEMSPLNAQSPYAASKLAADQIALAYHRSFGVPVVVLRPFNTYGPRQSLRAVLPTMLIQLIAGNREISLGRLDTRRDLTFVSDTVDGFIRAATQDVIGDVIHLGTGMSPSIKEIFDAACRAVGVSATVKLDPRRLRPDASEVMVLQSDPSRAAAKLGWKATVDLDAGLSRSVAWLRANKDRFEATAFVL